MRQRPLLVVGIALVLALAVSAFVYRSWLAAQGRTAVVLTAAVDVPVAAWALRVVTDEPRAEETALAGVPALLVRPGDGEGPWPALVFLNGATERGRHHPAVRRLADGLARAGYLVAVPDTTGLNVGEITLRTLRDSVAAVRAVDERPDTREGRAALAGVSVGTALALLVAEEPELVDTITLVAGIAPFAELRETIRLATTGRHLLDGRLVRYDPDPFVSLVVARSLAAGLPAGPGRDALREHLLAVDVDAPEPLAGLPAGLEGAAGTLVALLENDDPQRFDALYARLPATMREAIGELSPLARIERVGAPVELASAPHDKYFPLSDSQRLAAAAREGRLTVTETLDHAVPSASLSEVADLFRFYGFLARALRLAREG
jgi:pimeloyl-ACP methyl ester carboxylesterase